MFLSSLLSRDCFVLVKIHSLIAKVSRKFFTWTGVVAACSKVAMALSNSVGVIGPNLKTINRKCFNSTWELFRQQWLALTRVVCVSQFRTDPHDSNHSARRFSRFAAAHYGNIFDFGNVPKLHRQILSLNRKIISRCFVLSSFMFLCKTKDLQQSSIISVLNKIFKLEFHWVKEWIKRGWWTEWTAHVAAWLVRMLIENVHFSAFLLRNFVS